MSQDRNEKFIILLTTFSSIGLIIENVLMHWEYWVPIVVAFGFASLWIVHLSGKLEYNLRIIYYFFYAVLVVFYYGIHNTSLFDVALVTALVMTAYSILDKVFMMRVLLAEFLVILAFHLLNLSGDVDITYDKLTVSRILLHIIAVLLVYFVTTKTISDRRDIIEESAYKDERIDKYDKDMDDFLSNISHELRTPVNVVNGMSDLLIKRSITEAESIKKAGIRLAYQIEDIQDYTECKRDKVLLEEEDYMSLSLINDVVNSYNLIDGHEKLELVVNLDPKTPTMMKGDIRKLHKIFRHLLDNAVKFTRRGGIYVRMYSETTDYGVNLCIEMTDTGVGMDIESIQSISEGMYQVNKKRNRSTGGVGLGLFIVYGFAHSMGGFVKIESEKKRGTTIRVTIPQKVVNEEACLKLTKGFDEAIIFHVKPNKYKVPRLRDFYRVMASDLATGIRVPLYSAETVYDVERLRDKMNANYIFMGEDEYLENEGYFEVLAEEGAVLVVSAGPDFKPAPDAPIIVMPKPLYAYPVLKILNGECKKGGVGDVSTQKKVEFNGVKALVVDDEPMNLVVASGIFNDYGMIIDTAGSGKESIKKFKENDYDVVFMDHMMPEMDGVEAMKNIKSIASEVGKSIVVIALTANAVSGAREMFIREGFDGFVAKPINRSDFERVMLRELPEYLIDRGGEKL